MMQKNLGLITARSNKSAEMNHFFCSDKIMETKCGESTTQSYLFPLYIYQKKDNPKKRSIGTTMMLFETEADYKAKKPNLSPELVEQLKKAFKKAPSPEQIFFYIYGVLYSNIYRTKYAEFLKIDFPKIPFTKEYKLFNKIAKYGERLVDLHLLKSTELDSPVARFKGEKNSMVEKVKYEEGKLYINNDQYFEGIAPEIWKYQIGGYQVCDKWLKDRKGRHPLSAEEIKHYCKTVTALQKTIEVQENIDKIYSDVEKEVIKF